MPWPTPPTSASPSIRADRAARRELRRAVDDLDEVRRANGRIAPLSRWWWTACALVLTAAVVVAGFGVAAWIRASNSWTDADFTAVATDLVAELLSPDQAAPQRVQTVLDDATGAFYDEFAQSADAYTAFVRRSGTAASASIDGAAIVTRTTDSAVVLVAATVAYQHTGQAVADRAFRLRLAVADDSGRLKVAAVQYLP
ncbi:hypothetical protein EF294_19610 [Gordonia oryzae]|uniref:Mce-associated membrane protein n=1 Tax=Gordonia oryzae TaxID=2487349 RepID=A0A3N4GER3_9ACTN|nr:hypothetical protein [Gordonia oryzae]RPA57080.1 hypothetical protein EF294_19610 [Gordonia oryzae]